MERSDVRKRRREQGNITISRAGLNEIAQQHRKMAGDFRQLAQNHDEHAAYIEGMLDGSVEAPR